MSTENMATHSCAEIPQTKESLTESVDENRNTEKGQRLARQIIRHLSREIESTTDNMSVFRSKISLAIFLGPFLLLGSIVIGAKGLTISANYDIGFWICVLIDCGCYLSLAYMASRIEQQAGEQCNEWRKLIAKIFQDPANALIPFKNDTAQVDRDPRLLNIYRSQAAYLISYGLMLLSFIMSIVIVGKLRVGEPTAVNPPKVEASAPATSGSTKNENSNAAK